MKHRMYMLFLILVLAEMATEVSSRDDIYRYIHIYTYYIHINSCLNIIYIYYIHILMSSE